MKIFRMKLEMTKKPQIAKYSWSILGVRIHHFLAKYVLTLNQFEIVK